MGKSKLIEKGSSGCVFRPQLLCDGSKSKKTKKKISKLIVKKNKEYEINTIVREIPGYKKWTILWDSTCESTEYDKLLKNSDINECLSSLHIKSTTIPYTYKFTIYQGGYGGLNLQNYSKKIIKPVHFTSDKNFIRIFIKIFKLLHNIFYGLKLLNENDICHHDINTRNILINDNKSYIIDYDISLKINSNLKENDFLKTRMTEEFNSHRIYESYPYEYIYYNLTDKKYIIDEQKNIAREEYRINYNESYEPIHHKLFNIDIDNLSFEMLEDKLLGDNTQDLTELIKKLDVYSLGMVIFIIFIDICEEYDIPVDDLIILLKLKRLRPFMNLIGDMVKLDYRDRIDIHEAYERYLNLI